MSTRFLDKGSVGTGLVRSGLGIVAVPCTRQVKPYNQCGFAGDAGSEVGSWIFDWCEH